MKNLTILSNDVRVQDGLYSLNDLHKASGGIPKNRPSLFIRNDQTKELVEEMEKDGIPAIDEKIGQSTKTCFAIRSVRGGNNSGTWVCKELVYAYAMWISAKFHLHVIRAFDKAQNLPIEHNSQQTDKIQLINTMTKSMGLDQDVMVIQTIDVINMVQTIRGYQQAAQLLQRNPSWINETIDRVKTMTGRNVDM